jgi:VanZ family protein
MATVAVPDAEVGRVLAALRAAARFLLGLPRPARWLLPAGWMGLIWALSSFRPGPPGDGLQFDLFSNLAHAFEFGVLALLLLPLAPREGEWVRAAPVVLGAIAAVAIGYGFVDEHHQSGVPGRDASVLDLLTDAVGVFCTLKVALYVIDPRADAYGLRRELAAAVGLCLLAAGFSTVFGLVFGDGLWIR